MAINIKFDVTNTPETPTLILATKNGNKLGKLVLKNLIIRDSFNNPAEISFDTYKKSYDKKKEVWDNIENFKLVWCKEWNKWFEIKVDLNESNYLKKSVHCVQLGQAETSQIMIFNTHINTEDDIAREEYKEPTIFWNPENPSASLLHRLMEKAENYSIVHVDATLKSLQRTFEFDSISLYDALQEISEEIGCIFIFNSNSNDDGNIQRTISVYDIEANCYSCDYRGEFEKKCPKCGSTNIKESYGKDTSIFVTSDELADDILFTSDTDNMKNCFKLEAGDDLMTATIRNCNPNGTDYIWYISDSMRKDMSKELSEKLVSYDELQKHYQTEYVANISDSILKKYNDVVNKYKKYDEELSEIPQKIIGYPKLMETYYNTIDLSHLLQSSLMPSVEISDTNAKKQAALLTRSNLSPVSCQDVSKVSLQTANNLILSVAKILIDSRYKVKINTSNLDNQLWTGNFSVTNYSDDEDKATSDTITITLDDNYENFIRQKIEKALKKGDTEDVSISGVFQKSYGDFCNELKKYSLDCLSIFGNSCQACIDILIEQGIADKQTWSGSDPDLYEYLYMDYYRKSKAIESEIKIRQDEVNIITGSYDSDGDIKIYGIQIYIEEIVNEIQNTLEFKEYLGENCWKEFCSFKRESKYSNENYISDGLTNAEIFENALEFIETAKKEIFKSAELQHNISTTLKNLLICKKFEPILEQFEVGNSIRTRIEDKVYRLRLLSYEIDFEDLENISVDFSDVITPSNDTVRAIKSSMKAQSMTTTYSSVKKKADQGAKGNKLLDNWVEKGLDVTNTKIISGADNQTQTWDEHGMLFKKYEPMLDTFSDCQLKIINSTMAITDDNWKTVKTAVGGYYYFDPKTNELKYAYGINAETLVGKLILGEALGIYNSNNSMTFDKDGLKISNGNNHFIVSPSSDILLRLSNSKQDVLSISEDGKLKIVADGIDIDMSNNDYINEISSRVEINKESISTEVKRATKAEYDLDGKITTESKNLSSKIEQTAESINAEVTRVEKKVTDVNNNLSSKIEETIKDAEDFKELVQGTFRDGIITQTESNSIKKYIKELEKDKESIEKQYKSIINSVKPDRGSGNNLSIKFNKDCETEVSSSGAKYDYLTLYYSKNDQIYKVLEKVSGKDIAGKTYVVPSTDIYVYWYSDSSNSDYYGFSIDSMLRTTSSSTVSGTTSSLPDANIIETSSVAMISTSHPYEVRQEKLWHYKVSEVTKQALESYLSSYLTAYNQLIEAINTAILDDSATEEELNEINQKFGQYNTALAKIKAAIESVHTDISSDAAAEAVEYARANLKVTADEIAAEVERATSAEEKLKGSIKVTSDDITAEVSRATKAEEELRGSIKVNADAIKLKVTSKDVGSLIEQKADSIRLKASKISWESTYSSMTESGALTCKNATIKGTIYSENGKDIVRLRNGRLDICYNGVEIGLIGGNGLDGFSDKEGLNFDLEYTGDYMTWAAQSSPNSKYGMKWTYARSNFGNFTGDALNAGCDIDMHYHKIQRAKFSKITAENGYNGWTGEIPIITRIVSNNDGSISWWESSITVSNGIITSAPR